MKKLLLTLSILSCSLFANNIPTLKDLDLQKITKQEQFKEKGSKFLELLLLRIDSQELAKSVMVTFPDKKEKELEEAYYSFLEGFSHSYKVNMIKTNC